jgi:DNA-binding Lrp family transcriptional regulator
VVSAPLDDLDQRLLAELRADSRRPIAGLAASLRVARSTVQQRISRLEARGVIAGYTVRLGPSAGTRVRAQVGVIVDGRRIDEIVRSIAALGDARRIWTTSGQTDLLVELSCATPTALDECIDRIAEVAGVRSTSTTVLLANKLDRAEPSPFEATPRGLLE